MSLKDEGLEVRFESWFLRFERTDRRIVAEFAASHKTSTSIGRSYRSLFPNYNQPHKEVLAKIEKARETNELYTVPWGTVRAVRIESYTRHRDATKAAIGDFDVALKAFYDAYPEMVKQGLTDSNGLAQPEEYIPQEQIYSKFGLSITYSPMTDDGSWLTSSVLGAAEIQELQQQTLTHNQRCFEQAKANVRDQFCRILIQARDNLAKTQSPDGKDGKRFNVGWLQNLQQFCELWPGVNLDADPLVPSMLVDLQPVLKHTPETMRDSKQAQAEAHGCILEFISKYEAWLNA